LWATILTFVSSLTVWSKRQQKKKAIAELDKHLGQIEPTITAAAHGSAF